MSLCDYLAKFGGELDAETRRDMERAALSSEACTAPETSAAQALRVAVSATPAVGPTACTTRTRARTVQQEPEHASTNMPPPPPPVTGMFRVLVCFPSPIKALRALPVLELLAYPASGSVPSKMEC